MYIHTYLYTFTEVIYFFSERIRYSSFAPLKVQFVFSKKAFSLYNPVHSFLNSRNLIHMIHCSTSSIMTLHQGKILVLQESNLNLYCISFLSETSLCPLIASSSKFLFFMIIWFFKKTFRIFAKNHMLNSLLLKKEMNWMEKIRHRGDLQQKQSRMKDSVGGQRRHPIKGNQQHSNALFCATKKQSCF